MREDMPLEKNAPELPRLEYERRPGEHLREILGREETTLVSGETASAAWRPAEPVREPEEGTREPAPPTLPSDDTAPEAADTPSGPDTTHSIPSGLNTAFAGAAAGPRIAVPLPSAGHSARSGRRLVAALLLLSALVFALTRPEAEPVLDFAAEAAAFAARFTYGLTNAAGTDDSEETVPVSASADRPDTSGVTPQFIGQTPEQLMEAALLEAQNTGNAADAVQSETQNAAVNTASHANPRPANAGTVREVQYRGGTNYLALDPAGYVRNETDLSRAEVASLLATPSELTLARDGTVEVLLVCTHATEAYEPSDCGWYDPEYQSRSTDPEKNMLAVADAMAERLRASGVGVIVDRTMFDSPEYEGAYNRSAEAVREWLAAYPTIKVVLDIHRDALESDGERLKPTVTLDGKKTAQVMLVAGCDDGTFNMPNWAENLRFAAALQASAENLYPGLTRPLLFDYRKYNQDLSTGSLLVEVGGHGNTLEEAIHAARCVADGLLALD